MAAPEIPSFPESDQKNDGWQKRNLIENTKRKLAHLAAELLEPSKTSQTNLQFVSTPEATPGITRMTYSGQPLAIPRQGLTIISFQGPAAAISLPRGDWFCAEIDPTAPTLQEVWGAAARCDGPGAILSSERTRSFVMRPGQNEATIVFWGAARLDRDERQRFAPLFAIKLVRQTQT